MEESRVLHIIRDGERYAIWMKPDDLEHYWFVTQLLSGKKGEKDSAATPSQ